MTCKGRERVIKLARAMQYLINTELSSHEETRFQFNRSTGAIKLGIDVHQDFYVVVEQVSGSNPKPPQRFQKQACWRYRKRSLPSRCNCKVLPLPTNRAVWGK